MDQHSRPDRRDDGPCRVSEPRAAGGGLFDRGVGGDLGYTTTVTASVALGMAARGEAEAHGRQPGEEPPAEGPASPARPARAGRA